MRIEIEKGQVEVQCVLTNGLPQVLVDTIQLQQVILNLFRNAVEAMSSVTDRPSILHVKSEATEARGVVISVEE